MTTPLILFVLSLGVAMSVFLPGMPLGPDAFVFGILSATAAFVLLILAALRGDRPRGRRIAVIDGSNVMYWRGNRPDLATVRQVVRAARRQGLRPVVYFDANAGHLTEGRYLGPAELSRHIGAARRDVHVAPKGLPADPLLLKAARRLDARVISNDRFRDWTHTHPYVRETGFLVPGEVAERGVTLALA